MRLIAKQTLYNLPQSGYMTTQVPDVAVYIDGKGDYDESHLKHVECPDDWFIRIKHEGNLELLSDNPRAGYLFWSRKGWEANKEQIKEAFSVAEYPRGTWEEFEKRTELHYAKLESDRDKYIKRLENRIAKMRSIVI